MEDLRKSYYHKQADYYGNKNENIASSLSYLSVFFAPVILPIIMWIVASPPVSTHARKALFNHIMTWVCFALVPFALMFFAGGMNSATTNADNWLVFGSWLGAIILVIIGIYLFIVNIVRGIKLLLV